MLACVAGLALVACTGSDTKTGGTSHATPNAPPTFVEIDTPSDGGTPDAGSGTPDAGTPSDSDAGTPPPKQTACGPTAGEPRWVLEGEALTATVTCATGLTGPTLRFSVENLPKGASFDAASATLRWTPGLDQAAVWLLTLQEASTGETGTLKVGVAENEGAPGNVRIVDPAAYTEEYGLPVIHLFYDAQVGLTAGGYRPAQVVYRGKRYEIEAQYRGATSNVFPKRSLTLKFPDDNLFSEPVFGDGFKDRKRVVLITTFNDNTYFRPRLAFDVWNRMAPEHIRIHTFSAVVYANNRYIGMYTVADHPDKRLMDAHGLSKDSDLFKAVDANANFSRRRPDGTPKASLSEGLEKKEGTPPEGWAHAYDTMDALIGFVSDSSGTAFRDGFGAKLNARDYEDWWIFNTLILGTDSHSKNAYHAYDVKTGGPWRFIPWDLDATFGQNFDTTRTDANARLTFEEQNLLFSRMLAEPSIAGPLRERYRQLLRNELKEETVQSLIDGYVRETAPAAKRDWAKWGNAYRTFAAPGTEGEPNFPEWHTRQDFNSYEEEVEYVRQWVHTRWKSLEGRVP